MNYKMMGRFMGRILLVEAAFMLPALILALAALGIALLRLCSYRAQMLEMARVFRLPARSRFFYIYRPALKPFLYSGMKISLGMCWKSGVAAEVIGTPDHSIGEKLYMAKIFFSTDELFAWTAAVILLSFLFEKLVFRLLRRVLGDGPAV